MLIKIDENSTTAASEQLAKQIRRGVLSKKLHLDQKLPTVRQLAYDLDIAPNTVAKTYYQLQEEGFLELKGRKGTFVSASWKRKNKNGTARFDQLIEEIVLIAHQKNLSEEELVNLLKNKFKNINNDY